MDGAGALSFFRAARAGMLQGAVIDSYDDFPSVRIMAGKGAGNARKGTDTAGKGAGKDTAWLVRLRVRNNAAKGPSVTRTARRLPSLPDPRRTSECR